MSLSSSHQHHPSSSAHHHQHNPSKASSSGATFPPNAISSSASVFSRMPLEDVLEDLASRFILNLPIVELSHIERVCFQVEQAHWFYEDFVRPNSLLNLPSYHLKTFTGLFFEKCEFLTIEGAPLAGWDPKTAYEKFMRYKERVPVCGAIMFNEDATQVLLVRGFKANSSWSFPRGKINENELPRDCAIREVLEETGFDIEPYLSLGSNWSDDSKLSAIRKIRPSNPTPSGQNHQFQASHQSITLHSEGDDHFIEITIREQRLRMYLVAGIPNDTNFVTQTRQEIGRIAWFPLADLPTFSTSNSLPKHASKMINVSCPSAASNGHQRNHAKFYMVVPFVNDIRTWLTNNNLLTPVGQPLLTPRALEHQHPFVQTPPQGAGYQSHHTNVVSYSHSHHTHGFDSEAAAVHDRASRLQAFDFFQDNATPIHPSTHDSRLSSSKKKKKRNQQRKNPKIGIDGRLLDNSYFSDQKTTTDDDDELKVNETPWNDLEEGTRALQNFFFGSQNEDNDGEESRQDLTQDTSLGHAAEHRSIGNQPSNLMSHRHHVTQPLYVPQLNANPSIHYQVGRLIQSHVNPQLDNDEPLSEADTDVVKGYDIATSYASSMSSSYRGPSTQIPSSDEQSTPIQPAKPNNSSNLLSQIADIPTAIDSVTNAEAMYSKHGHLAAPRPQAAPQQVERLLAMLQAPTPGPSASADPNNLLSQLMSGPNQPRDAYASVNQGNVKDGLDLVSNTSNYLSQFSLKPVSSASPVIGTQTHQPSTIRSNPSFHQPAASDQPFRSPQTMSSDTARLLDRLNSRVVTPAEQVTPRAADLLDLLMKSGATSTITPPVVVQSQSSSSDPNSFKPLIAHDVATFTNGSSPSTTTSSATDYNHYQNRMPPGEEERKEKKEALLRQLQSLASLSIQSSNHTVSHNLSNAHVNAGIQSHRQAHRIAID